MPIASSSGFSRAATGSTPSEACDMPPILAFVTNRRRRQRYPGDRSKLLDFRWIARILRYAAGRLSRDCEAAAFISQNAHRK
jgi:hypothetical protein